MDLTAEQYELCYWGVTGKPQVPGWQAAKYFGNLPAALDTILQMKIIRSDINSIEELKAEIARFRKDLKLAYEEVIFTEGKK